MPVDIKGFLHSHCPDARIFIAYSGGVDSHVLLHLCASLPEFRDKITAVHVHHGLQAQAEAWGRHCLKVAESYGVAFTLVRVNAAAKPGQSPEEAARDARYQALQSAIAPGDAVLLAQHQHDQLETVLLQLFRGGGLKGLSGMPERMAFGLGWLLRPLLHVPKKEINAYALAQGLRWVEDPSNQASEFDRNFLRNDIIPLLEQRWPSLAKTAARSARHCADAEGLLSDLAGEWFDAVFDDRDASLAVGKLLGLEPSKRNWAVRRWFAWLGLKMPPEALVRRLFSELVAAREDAAPLLTGPGYELRRYRGRLYCFPVMAAESLADRQWDVRRESLPLDGRRQLCWYPSSQGILWSVWGSAKVEVRFRQGGEKIRLPKRHGSHSLKKLYQEAGVPPWQRASMPLLYLDGQLAAVGDRWVAADFYHEQTDGCIRLRLQLLQKND